MAILPGFRQEWVPDGALDAFVGFLASLGTPTYPLDFGRRVGRICRHTRTCADYSKFRRVYRPQDKWSGAHAQTGTPDPLFLNLLYSEPRTRPS